MFTKELDLMVWETVPTIYCLIFFLSSASLGFVFAVPNFTAGFMGLWN